MMIADCEQKINDEYMVMEMPNEAESNLPDLIKKLMKGDCCPDYRVRLKWRDLLDVLFYLDRLKNISEMPKLGKKPDYIPLDITDLIDMIGEPVYVKDGNKGKWGILIGIRIEKSGEWAYMESGEWQMIGENFYRTKEGARDDRGC